MAGIADYSTTAASNTSVGGVNIQGSAPASGMDNAVRAVMADIATGLTAGTFSATGYVAKSSGYTVAVTDRGKLIDCTAALELELPAAATAGSGFMFLVKANGGAVTLDPNGSENINGASASLVVPNGATWLVTCDGAGWQTGYNGLGVSSTATGTVGTLTSTAASSTTSGPTLSFDRTNATSANHRGGKLDFRYQDASGNALESFAALESVVFTATAGAEFGGLIVSTKQGGASADRWAFGLGFFGAGTVSGDMGANTINAVGYYINGNAIQATQADMETGTSTTLLVSPGRQHFHPGHPKFWAWVTQSGATPSLTTSYNVTSITDTNTGQLTVTITTDFSSADWSCIGTAANGATATILTQNTKAAGSVLVMHNGGSTDPSAGWNVMGLGDQA